MNFFKKKYFYLLIIFLIIGSERIYNYLIDGFHPTSIHTPFPFESYWSAVELESKEREKINKILDQPFTYLGKGAQSYVFESKDQKHVIKFFKFKHLRANPFIQFLPSIYPFQHFKESYQQRKQRKLIGVLSSHVLAFNEIRQFSGIEYIHLRPTSEQLLTTVFIDNLNGKWSIDLDQAIFLIQKKAEPFRQRLHRYLKENQIEKAQIAIQTVLNMYLAEYEKGIFDHDRGVLKNTGFIGSKAIHLDVGKLLQNEQMKNRESYKENFKQMHWMIHRWFHLHYPHLTLTFSSFLEKNYYQFIGENLYLDQLNDDSFPHHRLY